MRKHLMLIGVAGLTGMSLLGLSGTEASANAEKALLADAHFSSTNFYSPKKLAAAILEDVVEDNNEEAAKTVTVRNSSPEKKETGKKKTEEKNAKDLISNLNYDRLGVAKVDNWLNIRKKPGTDQKIIGKLPKNAGCNVYSIKKGWAKIKSGDVTGYVDAKYLVLDKEAEAYALKVGNRVATVKTETLNVRFLPATDSAIYTLVPVDEDMDIVKEKISKELIQEFIKNHFTNKEEKAYIKGVDKKAMYKDLDNWVLVRIDSDKVFVNKEYVDISYQLKKAVKIKKLTVKKKKKTASVQSSSSSSSDSTVTTSTRVSMVDYAMNFLGNRYVWGGTSLTNGTDCSGFTMSIYRNYGYSIPRTSSAQASASTSVSSGAARPGDLFFYGSGSSVSHVAMYIGNGQVIHASNERDGIKISNAYYRTPVKIGRFIHD